MSLNFENATVLSLDKTNKYFGSEYVFSSEKNLSITGVFRAPDKLSGVKDIQEDLEGFIGSTKGILHDVVINGHNFGKGKVLSFNSDSGNSVRLKEYTVDLVVYEDGSLSDIVGEEHMEGFNSLSGNADSKHILELSEDFSFERNNDTYSYSHNFSTKFAETPSNNPISLAQDLAKTILTSSPDFGFLDSEVGGFYNKPHKKIYSESYDKISKSCSFSESYEQNGVTELDYSCELSQSMSAGEDGYITVSESGQIKSLLDSSPSQIRGFIDSEIAQSYQRSKSFFEKFFKGQYLNSGNEVDDELVAQYASLEKVVDIFSRAGSYSVVYTNNKEYNSGFIHEKTVNLEVNEEARIVTQEGSFIGLGSQSDDSATLRYSNALSGFSQEKALVSSGLGEFYKDVFDTQSSDINQVSSSFTSNAPAGNLQYGFVYSDSPDRSDTSFKEVSLSENIELGVPLKNDFRILDRGLAFEQYLNYWTPTKKSVQVKVSGKRRTPWSDIETKAQGLANQYYPSGKEDVYLSEASSTKDPKKNTLELNVAWVYFEPSGSVCDFTSEVDTSLNIIDSLISHWVINTNNGSSIDSSYGCETGSVSGVSGNSFSSSSVNLGRGSTRSTDCPTPTSTQSCDTLCEECPESGICAESEGSEFFPCPTPSASESATLSPSQTQTLSCTEIYMNEYFSCAVCPTPDESFEPAQWSQFDQYGFPVGSGGYGPIYRSWEREPNILNPSGSTPQDKYNSQKAAWENVISRKFNGPKINPQPSSSQRWSDPADYAQNLDGGESKGFTFWAKYPSNYPDESRRGLVRYLWLDNPAGTEGLFLETLDRETLSRSSSLTFLDFGEEINIGDPSDGQLAERPVVDPFLQGGVLAAPTSYSQFAYDYNQYKGRWIPVEHIPCEFNACTPTGTVESYLSCKEGDSWHYFTPTPTPFTPSPSASSTDCFLEVECPSCGWDAVFETMNFSMSIWFKRSGNSQEGILIDKWKVENGKRYGFQVDESCVFRCGDVSDIEITNSSSIPTGEWVNLIISMQSSDGENAGAVLYLNGAEISRKDSGLVVNKSNTSELILGQESSGSNSFVGQIAEFRIYKRGLSPVEASVIYNQKDRLPDGSVPESGF